jgi:hypothetical protein
MQGNTHLLHSRYHPHTTASTARSTAGIATTMNVCEHVGLDTNQGLHHITPLSATCTSTCTSTCAKKQ